MGASKKAIHPLDLSEIRTFIASFLSNRDCISCMRVCRSWHMDFAQPVWNTIDFDESTSFLQVHPNIIYKYGHHIQNILNASSVEQAECLQHPAITSLKRIDFIVSTSQLAQASYHDLIRVHKRTIVRLEITGQHQKGSDLYISLDMFNPNCVLTSQTLKDLNITHCSLSSVLEFSPHLQTLSLLSLTIASSKYSVQTSSFCHHGLKTLTTSCTQISDINTWIKGLLLLFVFIPSLTTWTISDSITLVSTPDYIKLLKAVASRCRGLKNIYFNDSSSESIAGHLVHVFRRLESCVFPYAELSSDVLLGLIEHRSTLRTIKMTFSGNIDPSTPDNIHQFNKLARLLLNCCPCLEVLWIDNHQMEDNTLEDEKEIVCMNLMELKVRVLGLNTANLVDSCLESLSFLKRLDPKLVDIYRNKDSSISTRICKQLLRFKKLKMVWLGTKNYYFAAHNMPQTKLDQSQYCLLSFDTQPNEP